MPTAHGFKPHHAALLHQWANAPRDKSDAEQNVAYGDIIDAYEATAEWARQVKAALFPQGSVTKRSAPTDQGHKFKPYTWTRIYPWERAPRQLAYTVGIDSDGEFCVKLDTVSVGGEIRRRYEAIHGGDHGNSPISAILPFEEGLSLSLEELTSWSIQAIAAFDLSYGELARRVGLTSGPLRLLDDAASSTEAFRNWADIMSEGAERRGSVRVLLKHKIIFQETTASPLASRLGLDPRGVEWGVEINEPAEAGDYNVLSAIGEDDSGGLYLLRQGWLRGRRSAPDIREDAFLAATGLKPIEVAATGKAAGRRWFVVADLHSPPETIRRQTARFADLCWLARSTAEELPHGSDLNEPELHEDDDFGSQNGGAETGGWFTRSASAAREDERFRLRHGEVWLALTTRLAAAGIVYRKRRKHGFEIDLEIDRPGSASLLIEIKAGGGASALHTGIGQLYLYRKLMPRLEDSTPVLLMEERVSSAVGTAVKALGVALHHYDFEAHDEEPKITFLPDFLTLCGVS